jgi:hypothetical protein
MIPVIPAVAPQPFVPSRLVSVGLDGLPLRLIHTKKANGNVNMEYAALSHCWGRLLPLRTTTTTLAQFTQELPPLLIIYIYIYPATFAEAMRIARAAGIPYIWIDALCIKMTSRIGSARQQQWIGSTAAAN